MEFVNSLNDFTLSTVKAREEYNKKFKSEMLKLDNMLLKLSDRHDTRKFNIIQNEHMRELLHRYDRVNKVGFEGTSIKRISDTGEFYNYQTFNWDNPEQMKRFEKIINNVEELEKQYVQAKNKCQHNLVEELEYKIYLLDCKVKDILSHVKNKKHSRRTRRK